ncbi:MAG TPA: hypothetical protein ENH35_04680, partial [Candidatus Moranbacteria bacterium]|nr:hypothetical protein [Candidatus Moranbacteria bacterium]
MKTIKKLKSKLSPACQRLSARLPLRGTSRQVAMAGRKGSVLVFTLLVLFMLLISALGIASVTLIERKTSGTTG